MGRSVVRDARVDRSDAICSAKRSRPIVSLRRPLQPAPPISAPRSVRPWPSNPPGDETPFVAALERAVALQRFKATDVRSILQEVNVSLSSVPQLTFDNLAGLE